MISDKSPKEFEEFGKFLKSEKTNTPNHVFPYGYKERKQAFSPGGMIAVVPLTEIQLFKWVSLVFVHGGITQNCVLL